MGTRVFLLMTVFIMSGCENTEGQYRHDKKHHEQRTKPMKQLRLDSLSQSLKQRIRRQLSD